MELIYTLFHNNKKIVLIGLLFVFASAFANIGAINFINQTVVTEGQFFADHTVMFFSILVSAFVLAVVAQWLMTTLSYRVVYQLRGRMLGQILGSEYEHIQQLGRNKIYASITKDIRSIQDGFVMLPFFLYGVTLVIAGFGYMFWLNLQLAAITLGALGAISIVGKVLTGRFQALLRKERELEDDLFGGYEKVLDGHKELLLNEPRGQRLVDTVMQGPARLSRDYRTKADRYIIVNIHMMTTVILALIGLSFWSVFYWDLGTLGEGTAFALTLLFVRQPLNMAMNQLPGILVGRVALKKMQNLNLPEPLTQAQDQPLKTDWQTLTVSEVEYDYLGNTQFHFGPVSTQINRGELVFLVGHNGAGKTTFVRLLTGLTKPARGQISLDNTVITDDNRRGFRSMISAVLTDFHLFEQAALEPNSKQDEAARAWLKRLQLDHIVDVQDGQFSVVDLSTGQRKRLAMVTACLENRDILVLDEWAADQDPYFRKMFYEELLPELKAAGLTLIVVSHDDRFFHVADRVLELSKGGLVDMQAVG